MATLLKTLNFNGRANGITGDGVFLYVSDIATGEIVQLTRAGVEVKRYAAPSAEPQCIDFDGAFFWLCEDNDKLIYLLDRRLRLLKTFNFAGEIPDGIKVIGPNIYVVSYTEAAYLCDRNLKIVRTWLPADRAWIANAPWAVESVGANLLIQTCNDGFIQLVDRNMNLLKQVEEQTSEGLYYDGVLLWDCEWSSAWSPNGRIRLWKL